MAKIQSFSSVSVVDLTDVGTLQLFLTSSLPTTVTYNPNTTSYTPNWGTSNLTITPVISYNGQNIDPTSSKVSITYTVQDGNGSPTAISSTNGESKASGLLKVNKNRLASSSGIITYQCKVTYNDAVPVTATASLTYTLLSQATELSSCAISGESAFLYDTNKTLVGSGSITLTGSTERCSIKAWQYKTSDGTFVNFPTTNNTSITGNTLVVKATESGIWLNNDKVAVIKLVTDKADVYDYHQILKIHDGAPGNSTVAAVLSNENHVLSVNSSGDVKSWTGAETQIHIYEGGTDVTAKWTIAVSNGAGLTGAYDSDTKTYTPSALTADSSYADFACTRNGFATITKRYTITKQYAGADGQDAVVYTVEPDVYALNLKTSGTFAPTSVKFSAYQKVGNTAKTAYSGRFVISESTDGSTFTSKYTSTTNESSKTYTPSGNTVVAVRCALYAAGGTTTELDSQTIVITKDGYNGTSALSFGLGNYSDVIPCDSNGNVASAREITIPFFAYKGISRVPVTASYGTLPTGVTAKTNTAGTASADGALVLTFGAGATLGSSSLMTGDITITLTAEGKTFTQKYTWTKSKQAINGTNSVILQLYPVDGGTVDQQNNKSTTIKTMLMSGSGEVTPTSVTWQQFTSGVYADFTPAKTGTSITITPDMVVDQMWLKATAVYGGKSYSAYYTVIDTTDDIVAITYATVSQFKNSQGCGAIYTRLYRGGVEIDPIRTTVFSETAPSSPSSGDFYYKLDKSKKTCTLMKYSGTAWAEASETDAYTYNYYRVDKNGASLDTTTPYKTTRAFYIDPSIINGKMQFFAEVTKA